MHNRDKLIGQKGAPGAPAGIELTQNLSSLQSQLEETRGQLQNQIRLLNTIFEIYPDGMAVLEGPQLKFQWLNAVYRSMTPDPKTDPIGRPYEEIWPPSMGFMTSQAILDCLSKTGQSIRLNRLRLVFPDGSERYFGLHMQRIEGEPCRPRFFIKMQDKIREETGRQVEAREAAGGKEVDQATQELRESEALLRQMADSVPQLIWMARPDGPIDYFNGRFQEFDGITLTEAEGWSWTPMLHHEDLDPTLAAQQKAVETGEIYQIVHRLKMKDGSYRWHLSRGIPIRDEAGSITKWYGSSTDIQNLKSGVD
jgi:PAS domain S-box-containing protein